MTLTFNEVDNIIKTLPIGYYIGRNVNVTLSEGDASYYDAMHDEIFVSYQMLNDVLVNIEEDENPEETVRTLTYHEVSHALLTPRDMRMTDIRNIFEDERIETLLRKFYMNTDFKKFLLRVTKFKGEKPDNKMQAFYQLVRFRIGDDYFLQRVHDLIEKYKTLSQANCSSWKMNTRQYQCDIDALYDEFSASYDEKQAEMNNGSSTSSSKSESSSSNESSAEGQENNEDDSQMTSTSAETSEETLQVESSIENQSCEDEAKGGRGFTIDDFLGNEDYDEAKANEIVKSSLDCFVDSEITEQVQSILSRISKTSSRNGSTINAYSGVFDPRSVVRDDYKYFVQQNRNGHVRAYSKTHLTLVIDRSGSFYGSEKTVNKLLYALHQFERQNPDFSFDLITCGVSEEIAPKNKRQLTTGGGNLLDKKIFDLMKICQKPGSSNYNIILFDGEAFSDTWAMKAPAKTYFENFKAFNLPNATIISDPDNERYINRFCKNAKKVISCDYTNELIKHVMMALQMLTR